MCRTERSLLDGQRATQQGLLFREATEAVQVRREDREGDSDIWMVGAERVLTHREHPAVTLLLLIVGPRRCRSRLEAVELGRWRLRACADAGKQCVGKDQHAERKG